MRVVIHYVKGHTGSEQQAQKALDSFLAFKGWNPELREGYTPSSLPEIPYELSYNTKRKEAWHKIACAMNHARFYEEITEPTVFAEHDCLCTGDYTEVEFDKYLALCYESKHKEHRKRFHTPVDLSRSGVISYTKDNQPCTAAFIITPEGGKEILAHIEKNGLGKAEHNIRYSGVHTQALIPELCTLQPNLKTSWGW